MSVELGEEDACNRTNSRTGRPIRKGAGRKSFNPGFVNSEIAIDEVAGEGHEEMKDAGESDEDEGELGEDAAEINQIAGQVKQGRKQKKKPQKKRARSTSPPLSILDEGNFSRESTPERRIQEDDDHAGYANELPLVMSTAGGGLTINVTINVPKDYAGGPITLTLPSEILQQGRKRQKVATTVVVGDKPIGNTSQPPTHSPTSGWHSLSAELRNKIYRLLFVTEERIDFYSLHNLKRSAAFLATCRQVYHEGRSVLYMENRFHLERNKHPRNPYWSTKTEEVGWKDVRRFLKHISPKNIALLRDVSFLFDDALPSMSRELTHEQRRFVNDDHLMSCLRMLSKHGRLRKINLAFYGRRELSRVDVRFLENLYQIRADTVEFVKSPQSYTWNKIPGGMQESTVLEMTRRKKLYPAETAK